jgi:hypothetical protein
MPTTVPGTAEENEPVALALDASGRLSLLTSDFPFIQHWLWNGERWSRAEDLALDKAVAINELAATVVSDGSLGLIYSSRQASEIDGEAREDLLFFASRLLDGVAAPVAVPQPPATVTRAATPPAPTAEPLPSPVATQPDVAVAGAPMPSSQETAVTSGILPAGLVVLLGFALGLRLVRHGRH